MKRILIFVIGLMLLWAACGGTKVSADPAGVGNSHAVTLNFTDTTTGPLTFIVYRSNISGGPYTKIATVSVPTYVDGGLHKGIYFYVVDAVNNWGPSNHSKEFVANIQ